jgi:hypothetical protein
MTRKITLNVAEQTVLAWAAEILDRIPADQAWQFSLCGGDGDCFSLEDQATNLREIVGYADGSIQYDQPIGPDRKPVPFSEMQKVLAKYAKLALTQQIDSINAHRSEPNHD